MAYGTKQGVEDLLIDKFAQYEVEDAQLGRIFAVVDSHIDALLGPYAEAVPFSPVPTKISDISNLLAVYHILRARYTDNDPNKSAWVDRFKEDAEEQIKAVRENPETVFGAEAGETASDIAKSSTDPQDREFSVSTFDKGVRTSDEDYEGTQDVW